jgi:predicted DNA-binding transcriptional regulator YafY
MPMDRLERFYKIDHLLKERKVVSFAVFKDVLGMSRASVKRDLEYMRSRFNAPIEYVRELNGYRFGKPRSGPRYELPGLWFNATEVQALLTTLQLLTNLQPGLLDGQVSPLVERLRGILGSGDHSWKEIVRRIRIFLPERREGKAAHFSVIAAALLKRNRVWIKHYNRKEDRETEREISPQRLVHYRDNWYVDGYCHLREDLRSFAVDAIREAAIRDARAKEVPDAELDEYLGSGYGIFAGRKVEWATLKFSSEAARWVSAQSWHPKQRARVEKDGSYVLEVPYAEDRELVMEILKFGADVEVVVPGRLRARVASALKAAAQRYPCAGGGTDDTPSPMKSEMTP